MDAALKAIVEKFRASFTRRKRDVLESPLDQPLALSGNTTVASQASALPIASVVTEKLPHEAPGVSSEKTSDDAQKASSAHLRGDSNSSGSNVAQIPTKAVTVGLPELIARCNENALLAKEKAEREAPSSKPLAVPGSNVVRLPMWPDATRCVPNGMLRSALFGAIKKGPRRYMNREEIAAQDGIQIFYTGQRLDQGDLDVWETVLHIARVQALGDDCRVTAYQLLKALGKKDTGSNRDTLESRLSRMKATGVDVHVGRYGYEGSLIDEVYRDKETREYVIRLNPKLSILFAADQFTQIDWDVRHALDGQPLAQWLHGYYASHAQPFPVKAETLLTLSGSENEAVFSARQKLRKALDALTDASNANNQPFRYEICGDLVHVERKASATQRRYLAKKVIRKLPRGKL